jgi:hypothetical protein
MFGVAPLEKNINLCCVAARSAWISLSAEVTHDCPMPGDSGSGIGDQCATSSGSIVRIFVLSFAAVNPPLRYT